MDEYGGFIGLLWGLALTYAFVVLSITVLSRLHPLIGAIAGVAFIAWFGYRLRLWWKKNKAFGRGTLAGAFMGVAFTLWAFNLFTSLPD
jgi:hypothetical protein